ncbi:MAG: hypothetical protein JNM39_00135 [Bdellovibrionaceae bacterium]|nr:hypothetical protein [Pseudobdellovibrionaceae bacterium]
MRCFSRCILIALFPFSLGASAANEDSVYVYTISLENAASPWNSTGVSERVAKALGPASKDCVDFRSLGSKTTGQLEDKGTIGIVINSKLSSDVEAAIKKAVCTKREGLDRTFVESPENKYVFDAVKNCKVNIAFKSAKTSDVELVYRHYKRDEDNWDVEDVTKGTVRRLPRFSSACDTGSYKDSWHDAGSTQEARLLSARILGGRKFDTISMRGPPGLDWSFGFASEGTKTAVQSLGGSSLINPNPGQQSPPSAR